MVTVSRTARLLGCTFCAKDAEVAALSNFINMLPLMATTIKTAKVKLAKREVRFEAVNILISPNFGPLRPVEENVFLLESDCTWFVTNCGWA